MYHILTLIIIGIIIYYLQTRKRIVSANVSFNGLIIQVKEKGGEEMYYIYSNSKDGLFKLKRLASYLKSNRLGQFKSSSESERLEHKDNLNFAYLMKVEEFDYKLASKKFLSLTSFKLRRLGQLEYRGSNDRFIETFIKE